MGSSIQHSFKTLDLALGIALYQQKPLSSRKLTLGRGSLLAGILRLSLGTVIMAIPPRYSSQKWARCGETAVKTLCARSDRYPRCGTVRDRHHNATTSVLRRRLDKIGGTLPNPTPGERRSLPLTIAKFWLAILHIELRIPRIHPWEVSRSRALARGKSCSWLPYVA